jgi:hypothetical protein
MHTHFKRQQQQFMIKKNRSVNQLQNLPTTSQGIQTTNNETKSGLINSINIVKKQSP